MPMPAPARLPSCWTASWIWLEPVSPAGTYALLRREFVPARHGSAVWLYVTAGHHYHLWLNGREVGRGPDRGYFRAPFVHACEVTEWLRPGTNVLAARVHWYGEAQPHRVERHAAGPPGFLLQLEDAAGPLLGTDAGWQARRDPAYACPTEPASYHRCWKELYHAAREPAGWREAGAATAGWQPALVVAPAEGGPWHRLLPKLTPDMTADEVAPRNLYLTQRGGFVERDYDRARLYDLIRTSPRQGDAPFTWHTAHQPRQELLFDLGEVLAGYPRLEFGPCPGGGQVEVYYGDSMDLTHWDTLVLGPEPLTWTPFSSRGARWFRLELTGAPAPVPLRRVRWVRTQYPVTRRATFASSDAELNAIWAVCTRSAERCAMEHFTDCVGREQVLWLMDFRFQALQHYHYFGDTALARKCLRQFAALQLPSGPVLCYGPSAPDLVQLEAGPTDRPPRDWFGFNFYYLLALREYADYSGDLALVRELLPVTRRLLAYYQAAEQDGFARHGALTSYTLVDWGYDAAQDGPVAFMQALYYAALTAQAELCRSVGETAEAEALTTRAAALEARFFARFADLVSGLVADALVAGRPVLGHSVHAPTAALRFFAQVPPTVRAAALAALADPATRPSCTGFFTAHVCEALYRHGAADQALAALRRWWGAVVAAGLPQTPEVYPLDEPPGADVRWSPDYSRCHSYASLAGVLLQRWVLGATVEGATVRLREPLGGVTQVRGMVPTVAGDCHLEWRLAEDGWRGRVAHAPGVSLDASGCAATTRLEVVPNL
jgi:hypothetical protein